MFHALVAAIYVTLGLPEVYRILFEVFGFDVDAPECQPRPRYCDDQDRLSPELDGERLTWQEIAYYEVNISNLLFECKQGRCPLILSVL